MDANTHPPRGNRGRITPSPRYHQKSQVDLFKYLYEQGDLIVHYEVADEFGFTQNAFTDILEAGLGPHLSPALVDRHFWFTKDVAIYFWFWLKKEATEEELKQIAEIIRWNDEIGDFRFAYKLEPREMIFCALESRREYRCYSKRLRLDLTSPEFEVPFTGTCTESVQC